MNDHGDFSTVSLKNTIIESIKKALSDESVEVRLVADESFRHIELYVSYAEIFRGKSLIDCHRLVMSALDHMIASGTLHAVSVKIAPPP